MLSFLWTIDISCRLKVMKLQPRIPSIRQVLSWLLILGLFLELTLRALTAWKEPKGRFMWMLGKNRLEVMAERDGYRFFKGRKNQRVKHGAMRIDFNNLGYRSKEREVLPKTEDQLRVACFGDSVTLGQYQWDYYDTWPGAIERILTDYPTEKKVEVLNFGMAHYSYTTNLVNLALIGEFIKPDIVIYLIGPNDFVCLYTKDYAPDGSHDGQWLLPVTDSVWGFHPFGSILKHSRVCNLIYGNFTKLILFLEAAKLFNYSLSDENLPPRLEKMALHLGSFCAFAKTLGATPVLCTYLYDEIRMEKDRGKDFEPMLNKIDDTVRKVARTHGAILVEGNSSMRDHPEYFSDDFHMNAKGSEVFAQILIKELEHHDLLPLVATSPAVPSRPVDSPDVHSE